MLRLLLACLRPILNWRDSPDRAIEVEGDLVELWRHDRMAWPGHALSVLTRRRHHFDRASRRSGRLGETMSHDVRYALRIMRRQPLFAALTVTTLAVGIAASTAIFTSVDRLLLQALPFPDSASLVSLEGAPLTFANDRMDLAPGALDLGILQAGGLYARGGLNVEGLRGVVRVPATVASPGFFQAMAVAPTLGRTYTAAENGDDTNRVAVISHGLWDRQFGRDPRVTDRSLMVNQRAFRVLGVMPEGFTFPGRTDVWIPVFADRQTTGSAFAPEVIARLSPGTTAAAAAQRLRQYDLDRGAPPDADPPRVLPLQDVLTSQVRPVMLLLTASVGLVLLVATSNVAGLLLARTAGRRDEFVLRRALGGSRWRLTRQLGVEALVFSAIAAAVGLAGAKGALIAVSRLATDLPAPVDLTSVDLRMVIIALAVSVGGALVFGLVPGVIASSQRPAEVLRTSHTSAGSRSARRFRHVLVGGQVAAALVLLTVTTLAAQTMVRLARYDLGFRGDNALAFEVTLPLETYDRIEAVSGFYERAIARLRSLPGVVRAGATGVPPGYDSTGVGLAVSLPGPDDDEPRRFMTQLTASPGYFEAMGIRVVQGRPFEASDRSGQPPVVILSLSAARMLWPDDTTPVGRMVEVRAGRPMRVVGVVDDVSLRGPIRGSRPEQMYRPIQQQPPFGSMTFVVHSARALDTLAPAIRDAMTEVDESLPIYNLRPIRDITDEFLSSHQLSTVIMGTFAAVTLLLAAVGLYGVLSQLVAQRTREIGIRMALGADAVRLRLVLIGRGLRLAAVGVVAGGLMTHLASQLLAAYVPTLDPLAWTTVSVNAVVLLVVAGLASWVPASRASRIDPAVALR